jgi:hypothetical protein
MVIRRSKVEVITKVGGVRGERSARICGEASQGARAREGCDRFMLPFPPRDLPHELGLDVRVRDVDASSVDLDEAVPRGV